MQSMDWWQYPQLILPQQIPAPEPTTVLSFGLSVVILRLTVIGLCLTVTGQLKCTRPKCIIRLSTEQITYGYEYLNISIKISVSQTIIGNKKLLHILKSILHLTRVLETTKTIYSLLLFSWLSNYLDTLEMFQWLNIHHYRHYRHPTETWGVAWKQHSVT